MSKMSDLDVTVQNLSERYELPYDIVAKLIVEKDKLKLVYMWIKQQHVTLGQFRNIMLMVDEIYSPLTLTLLLDGGTISPSSERLR